MLTNLSGPQKVLVVFSALLTFCYLLAVGYVLFLQTGNNGVNIQIPDLVDSSFSIAMQNVGSRENTTARSDQEISIDSLTSATWENNRALFLENTKVTITKDSVSLTTGAGLFNVADNFNISGWQMNSASFVLLNNQLYLFLGEATKGQTTLEPGNKVELTTDAVGNISRREVINLNELSTLRQNASIVSSNIPWLTDITAPKLLSISPIPNAVLFTNQVTVTGELDDETATVEINGAEVANQNARFSTEVLLEEGENTILVRLSDIYGNSEVTELLVNYEATAR